MASESGEQQSSATTTHSEKKDRSRRRATAADVAGRAGVSRATVSYVLNDTPHQVIPDHTRTRVRNAAAELGYTPSAAARALRSGRSEVVLLLLPDWPIGPSVGFLLEHLSTAFASSGYTFVAHPRSAGRPISEVWKVLTPAAVISFEALDDIESARLRAAGVEFAVALFGGNSEQAMHLPEQRTGRMQAEHLVAAGHRRLGYAWPQDPRLVVFAQARLEGVQRTCADFGLPEPLVHQVNLGPDGAVNAVAAWVGAQPAVSGICAYNDETALGVLAAARRHRLDVPGDLAVIGVDNTAAGALFVPTLTTIEVNLESMALDIAHDIARRLGEGHGNRYSSPGSHRIIVRESAPGRGSPTLPARL